MAKDKSKTPVTPSAPIKMTRFNPQPKMKDKALIKTAVRNARGRG